MLFGYEIVWQAWATLAAGLIAVAGAVIIAKKQLEITSRQVETSNRQAEIQAGQLQLQQLSLKVAIFERRMRVFETALRYVARIQSNPSPVTQDETRDFYIAVSEARFLFTTPVYSKLKEWSQKCAALQEARSRSPKNEEEKVKNAEEITSLIGWLNERAGTFSGIFKDEIAVSDISIPVGPNRESAPLADQNAKTV
jgi:DNA repair exonuclease SbcCD ATPase subunit